MPDVTRSGRSAQDGSHMISRRVQMFALIGASLALGLLLGGFAAWLPLAAILISWVAWEAGDRCIRGVMGAPRDAPPVGRARR
jgi:hypothetical protein